MTETSEPELAIKERAKNIEQIYVRYPHLNHVKQQIKHCHEYSKLAAEPECMLVTGIRGVGKTTLINDYTSDYPRVITKEGTRVPVLAASIPVPASAKSLVTELLSAFGDPNSEKGTTITQTKRLKQFIKDCAVELIILDEFQHFIDRDSYSVLNTAADWLKKLIDDTKCPVVLVGLAYSSVILKTNAQLERRFSMQEKLSPLVWSSVNGKSANQQNGLNEVQKFLNKLDDSLPFEKKSNLESEEMAFRIYYATEGVIGYIMKLIRRAAYFALKDNLNCLNLNVLAKAYEERLSHRVPLRQNPFLVEDPSNINIEDLKKLDLTLEVMPARIKGRKSEIAEMLRWM